MTKPIYIAIMSSLSSVINLSAHKSVLSSFGQLHTISLTMNISNRGNVSALLLEGNSIVVKTVSKRRGALPFWFWQMEKNAISWVIEEMIQVSEHVDTFVIFMEFRHALWRVWKRNGRRVGGNVKVIGRGRCYFHYHLSDQAKILNSQWTRVLPTPIYAKTTTRYIFV